MAWVPVDDTQTPNWGVLAPSNPLLWGPAGGSNTPNWGSITTLLAGAFQLGAFQPAFQIGSGPTWQAIDDSETPNWAPVT